MREILDDSLILWLGNGWLANLGNRDLVDIEYLKKRFIDGEYAISDHAIIDELVKSPISNLSCL